MLSNFTQWIEQIKPAVDRGCLCVAHCQSRRHGQFEYPATVRVPYADIPANREARLQWLYDRWKVMDALVGEQRG
jgi:hypothetical protein